MLSNKVSWEYLTDILLKDYSFFLKRLDQQSYETSNDKFNYLLERLLSPLKINYVNDNTFSPIEELLQDAIEVTNSILDLNISPKIYKLQTITNYLYNNQFLLNIIHISFDKKLPIFIINPVNFTIQIGSGKNSIWLSHSATDNDSYLGTAICHNKVSSYHFIEKLNYPQPKQELLLRNVNVSTISTSIGFPCVLKPVDGHKGNGVIVGINSLDELKDLCVKFLRTHSAGIIQEQVYGYDYRLVVINGKLDFVILRQYPSIIGNGISTVEELILEKNTQLINFSETYGINGVIDINNTLLSTIKHQGYSLDSVLEREQVLILTYVANINQGANRIEIPLENIHPEIKWMVETIAVSSRVHVLGIDIISNDISKPLLQSGTKVIELNTNPEFIQQRALDYFEKITKDKNLEIYFEKLDLTKDLKDDYYIIIQQDQTDIIEEIKREGHEKRLITYDEFSTVLLNAKIEKAYML